MSMLNRFRKPGGFQQLLTLIETCEPAKQKNLLHLVGTEDPGWASLVKTKSLNIDRVLSWPVETLMEITPHLPDMILLSIYHYAQAQSSRDQNLADKILESLPSIKAKELRSLADSRTPNPAEQASATIKVIQTVRDLESKGLLRFSKIDPSLEIDKRLAA